jgi:hypothetical protein
LRCSGNPPGAWQINGCAAGPQSRSAFPLPSLVWWPFSTEPNALLQQSTNLWPSGMLPPTIYRSADSGQSPAKIAGYSGLSVLATGTYSYRCKSKIIEEAGGFTGGSSGLYRLRKNSIRREARVLASEGHLPLISPEIPSFSAACLAPEKHSSLAGAHSYASSSLTAV